MRQEGKLHTGKSKQSWAEQTHKYKSRSVHEMLMSDSDSLRKHNLEQSDIPKQSYKEVNEGSSICEAISERYVNVSTTQP